jgi:Ubiquinol-cytochrome C reductase complex 14kD subunit
MALQLFYNRCVGAVATWYQRALAKELNKVGMLFSLHDDFCCWWTVVLAGRSCCCGDRWRRTSTDLYEFVDSHANCMHIYIYLYPFYSSQIDYFCNVRLFELEIFTGLRYEDLLMSEGKDMQEALALADPEVVKGRMRRLKRASDLCFKQKTLQDYAPDMKLEPFKFELYDDLLKIRKRNEEFNRLNRHKN